jgi:hypothetical protein
MSCVCENRAKTERIGGEGSTRYVWNVQLGLNPPKGLFRSGNGWMDISFRRRFSCTICLSNGVPYALYSNAQDRFDESKVRGALELSSGNQAIKSKMQ